MSLHCNLHKASFTLAVLVCIVSPLVYSQLPSDAPKSYLRADSYSQYPPWIPDSQGLLMFTFRTTQPNGLLLYMDSEEQAHSYLKLSLFRGYLQIEVLMFDMTNGFIPDPIRIGEELNDNENHTVSVELDTTRAVVTLDSLAPETVTYGHFLSNQPVGSSGLFFSGVPDSIGDRIPNSIITNTANNDTHFSGCIMDIRYSNVSVNRSELSPVSPLVENAVTEGCPNLCEGVECGGGVCVSEYPAGFCDCRGTGLLGPNCSEDPVNFSQAFNGDTYRCYVIEHQPTSDEETTLSVTLIPPLPLHGVIMTGSSSVGISYILAIDDGNFLYSFQANTVPIMINRTISFLNHSASYQVDIAINRTYIILTVIALAEGISYRSEKQLDQSLLFDPNFENVCLGGVALEMLNYIGVIQNAFVDYYSLTEDHLFTRLQSSMRSRSSVIRILSKESVEFQTSHFNAIRIVFDFRTTVDDSGGFIVQLQDNTNNRLDLATFNENVVLSGSNPPLLCNINVEDQMWHHFELLISPEGIEVTIDCKTCVNQPLDDVNEYLSNSLMFGSPSDDHGTITSRPFLSCFRNILFEYNDGQLFRPNLEVLTQNRRESFSDECDTSLPTFCKIIDPNTTVTDPNTTVTTPTLATDPSTTVQPTTTSTTNATQPLIGIWVGIGVAVFASIVIAAVLILLCVLLCWKGMSGRGFYKTYESNEKNVSALHFSASLKQLSSEVVHQNNGQLPAAGSVQANGGHSSKEFYL